MFVWTSGWVLTKGVLCLRGLGNAVFFLFGTLLVNYCIFLVVGVGNCCSELEVNK